MGCGEFSLLVCTCVECVRGFLATGALGGGVEYDVYGGDGKERLFKVPKIFGFEIEFECICAEVDALEGLK